MPWCSKCSKPGHNKSTCLKVKINIVDDQIPRRNLTYHANELLSRRANRIYHEIHELQTCKSQNYQVKTTAREIYSGKYEEELTEYFNTVLSSVSSPKLSLSISPAKSKWDAASCKFSQLDPKIEIISNAWKTVRINKSDGDVLGQKCLKRFHQGPSADDGPGFIYMYKLQNSGGGENSKMFKIGRSLQLPHRRVRTQEVRNNEVYEIVHSKETENRKLTELLIHLMLKDKGKHCNRNVTDGGTEWFEGNKVDLIQDINFVIRFVRIYAPNF